MDGAEVFDLHRTDHDVAKSDGWHAIALWSHRDRSSIAPRSQLDRTAMAARSHRDPSAVESRSWILRGEIVTHGLTTLVGHDYHEIVATNRPTTTSNGHKIRREFLFKNPCISSSFFNFWSIREGIKRFRGRSLVHRDPPAFRLDCDAIGVGLITNSSLISSNFPLEFRMSARKNPSKFASIHENWSQILTAIGLVVRFNRLSRGNLSFY